VPVETINDVLRGEKALQFSVGVCGDMALSFYGGGVFDSAGMCLRAQSMAEKCRYIVKHGSDKDFRQRFIHAHDLFLLANGNQVMEVVVAFPEEDGSQIIDWIFDRASVHWFPDIKRAPIGLNPERFIPKCKNCKKLLRIRFQVSRTMPRAKAGCWCVICMN
jgi:hypothetical protein